MSIDPLLPIADFRTLSDVRAETLPRERFEGGLLGALAGLALLLAVVGFMD
jgi:DMSO reductase anchor subunit